MDIESEVGASEVSNSTTIQRHYEVRQQVAAGANQYYLNTQ